MDVHKHLSPEIQARLLSFVERVALGSTLPDGINHDDDSLIELLGRVQYISRQAQQAVEKPLKAIAWEANQLYLAAVKEKAL
jgi:hypothetical protein